ncbi:enoyl-CoA hydratase/carnithine racemase [Streptosporangium album]|uniref:Enoyl-CoA hydratase/carnithine racemase n=1 Tax=Streptosporangium album TaxID=47479 RepID=A0A7W7S6K0_9ACTN|nr:enoyl-CoA hydratase/isomerase family protein [Streptosporangium album]MBB4944168.1 enoyl-CoA hydratase/carnithine racemase [Streptosporangium album]
MSDVPHLSIADVADGSAHGPLLDQAGAVRDPFVAVQLDDAVDPVTLDRAVKRARSCDRLLVGVVDGPLPPQTGELVSVLDLTLTGPDTQARRDCVTVPDPQTRLGLLYAAVVRNPHASVVLGSVLRTGEALPVSAALDLESFAYSALLGGPEFHRWLSARRQRPVPPAADDPITVKREEDRLLITLNRPERRNAYGRDVRDALVEALRLAVFDDTITMVVLNGAGPSFCSGGDLDEFGTTPDLVTAHLVRTRAGAGRLVHELAARIEVRVHGSCVGAGIELPAFAGAVIADPGTTFRLPEVSMGLIPGAGGTVSLPRRIGRWRTLDLALSGKAIDAATAMAWGLIDGLLPRE